MRHVSLEETPLSGKQDKQDLREKKSAKENEKATNPEGTVLGKEIQKYIRRDEDLFAVMVNGGF